MKGKHLPLENIDDGDLVLLNWDGEPMFAIKASNGEGHHYVCILRQRIWDVPGPLLTDGRPEVEFITLGSDWSLDYEPTDIQFGLGRLPLGSLRFTEDGPVVTCHSRNGGGYGVTTSGKLVRPGQNHPSCATWRLLLETVEEEHRQVVQWPQPADDA